MQDSLRSGHKLLGAISQRGRKSIKTVVDGSHSGEIICTWSRNMFPIFSCLVWMERRFCFFPRLLAVGSEISNA